jgi:hypothetical protein
VKLPVISPEPLVIGDWIVGADWTTPSSTMASCFPLRRVVTSANFDVPPLFSVNATRHPGLLTVWLPEDVRYWACALDRSAPVISTGPRT